MKGAGGGLKPTRPETDRLRFKWLHVTERLFDGKTEQQYLFSGRCRINGAAFYIFFFFLPSEDIYPFFDLHKTHRWRSFRWSADRTLLNRRNLRAPPGPQCSSLEVHAGMLRMRREVAGDAEVGPSFFCMLDWKRLFFVCFFLVCRRTLQAPNSPNQEEHWSQAISQALRNQLVWVLGAVSQEVDTVAEWKDGGREVGRSHRERGEWRKGRGWSSEREGVRWSRQLCLSSSPEDGGRKRKRESICPTNWNLRLCT